MHLPFGNYSKFMLHGKVKLFPGMALINPSASILTFILVQCYPEHLMALGNEKGVTDPRSLLCVCSFFFYGVYVEGVYKCTCVHICVKVRGQSQVSFFQAPSMYFV